MDGKGNAYLRDKIKGLEGKILDLLKAISNHKTKER